MMMQLPVSLFYKSKTGRMLKLYDRVSRDLEKEAREAKIAHSR